MANFRKSVVSLILVISLVCVSIMPAFAEAILVGGSSNGAYKSKGNCVHDDRYSCLYVDKFLSYVTQPVMGFPPRATQLFNWKDEDAWEKDFLHSDFYGVGYDNVDDVDFMVFSGHGYSAGLHGVPYNSLHFFTLKQFN